MMTSSDMWYDICFLIWRHILHLSFCLLKYTCEVKISSSVMVMKYFWWRSHAFSSNGSLEFSLLLYTASEFKRKVCILIAFNILSFLTICDMEFFVICFSKWDDVFLNEINLIQVILILTACYVQYELDLLDLLKPFHHLMFL